MEQLWVFEASFRLWLQKCQVLLIIAPSPAPQSLAVMIVSGPQGGWRAGCTLDVRL